MIAEILGGCGSAGYRAHLIGTGSLGSLRALPRPAQDE